MHSFLLGLGLILQCSLTHIAGYQFLDRHFKMASLSLSLFSLQVYTFFPVEKSYFCMHLREPFTFIMQGKSSFDQELYQG